MRYCDQKLASFREVPIPFVKKAFMSNTIPQILGTDKDVHYIGCAFYLGMATFATSGWFRPPASMSSIVNTITRRLHSNHTGASILALHLRTEPDFLQHCRGSYKCYRTPRQIVHVACNVFKLPCKASS